MKEIMKASPNFGKGVSYKMCVVDEFHDMKELLEENTKLKAYNEKLLNGDIEKHNKIVELQKVCQDLSDKFDFQVKQAMKLEKENAELREKVERYYCLLEKSMDCETCKYCDLSDDRKKEPCKSCFFDSSKWELKE
jgi:hypothetical protein